MPLRRIDPPPRHTHPEIVEELAMELKSPREGTGEGALPLILEERQRYGNNLHVTVIWDRWRQVRDKAERGAIILDAYHEAGRLDDAKLITMALGVTQEEAQRLGIEY